MKSPAVRAALFAVCLYTQDQPETRVLLVYAKALLEEPLPTRKVVFAADGANASSREAQMTAAAFRQEGLAWYASPVPHADTMVVMTTRVAQDSVTSAGRFFRFDVEKRQCVGGTVERERVRVRVRCDPMLVCSLVSRESAPVVNPRQPCD
jgi:hypothetical protein